ncbi:MAG: BMP family ABC transporter substrate-binding protein [Desertimonas sp.]
MKRWAVGLATAGLAVATAGATTSASTDTTEATDTTTEGTATEGTAVETTPCPTESFEEISIGLVTDTGKVDDKSFNQSAWEGAEAAAEAVDGTADYIETVNSADYANNIAQFVDSGANIIITVGFGMAEATVIAAADNPDICFIGVDQFQAETLPNVTGLVFPEDQAGFLAGALAASLSESGTIAAVLGTDQVPPVVAFGEGYANGAEYINPDIEVIKTYHPGGLDTAFSDPEWGGTTARQAIDNGADIVFGAGGNTGNGALIEVASDGGDVLCIGVDTDQWETVPEAHPCLVTSAMKLIDDGVVSLVEMAADGGMPSGNYFGEVGLADYHDLADSVPEDVAAAIEELTPQVLSGEVPTGYTP